MPLGESCTSCIWNEMLRDEVKGSGVRTRMTVMEDVEMAVAR